MKTQLTILVVFLTLCSLNLYSQTDPTVREQLEGLNKYWKTTSYVNPVLHERTQLTTDVGLITTHLLLVENHLRTKRVALTETQHRNRNRCLDILKEYRERGVYPINLYHPERTPYFIDDYGTACAVGQLILSSGHEALANKISAENNYAYIEDLNYPELVAWADTYGFTVDELKWIQPAYDCNYPICPNDSIRNVSCYGAGDGCFGAFPTPLTLSPPYMYSWFWLNPTSGSWVMIDAPCDLGPGTFKARATSFTGDFEDFIYEIQQPDSISTSATASSDNGTCNGSITVSVSGGKPPYTVFVSQNGDAVPSLSGLCFGTYTVLVTDSNNCNKLFEVTIEIATAITGFNSGDFIRVFPNPAHERIGVATSASLYDNLTVMIYDYTGREIMSALLQHGDLLDISQLNDGAYILKVGSSYWRFIKSSR